VILLIVFGNRVCKIKMRFIFSLSNSQHLLFNRIEIILDSHFCFEMIEKVYPGQLRLLLEGLFECTLFLHYFALVITLLHLLCFVFFIFLYFVSGCIFFIYIPIVILLA
jgi:hypothetical protein